MIATVLGLDHDLQWRDPTGDLARLLESLIAERTPELIGEEAHHMPTTVAQRLCCRLNLPWMNIDMSDTERKAVGIHEELLGRFPTPIFENLVPVGTRSEYLSNADRVREEYWITQIQKHRVGSVIVLCGLLHLKTVIEKMNTANWVVREINVCELEWYKTHCGTVTVSEGPDGTRWCESRNRT